MRCHVLWHLIWVCDVCSGLSSQIHMVNMVLGWFSYFSVICIKGTHKKPLGKELLISTIQGIYYLDIKTHQTINNSPNDISLYGTHKKKKQKKKLEPKPTLPRPGLTQSALKTTTSGGGHRSFITICIWKVLHFSYFATKNKLWVLINSASWGTSNEYPQHVPVHNKTYNKICVTSEDRPACASAESDQSPDCMCLLQPLGYPKKNKREPLPYWVDVQDDLSLCWSHKSYCRFCRGLAHMFLWRNKENIYLGTLLSGAIPANTQHCINVITTLLQHHDVAATL